MDQSRFIARHVVNLPKSGIRDFFDIVAKVKDAISLGVGKISSLQSAWLRYLFSGDQSGPDLSDSAINSLAAPFFVQPSARRSRRGSVRRQHK